MRILARKHMNTIDVAARFLDRADIPVLRNTIEKCLLHADAGAARVVVKHDRQVGDAIDLETVCGKFLLAGQRIRRGSNEQCIGAGFPGCGRKFVTLLHQQIVDSGDNGNAARHPRNCERVLFDPFFLGQGEKLAGGPADDDAVRAVLDLPVDDLTPGVVVD